MPDFLFHEFLEKNSIKSIGFRKNIMTNDREVMRMDANRIKQIVSSSADIEVHI